MRFRKFLFLTAACLGLTVGLSLLVSHYFLQPATFRGHTDFIISVTSSPDGKTLASVSRDKTIKLWDLVRGKELASLPGHTGIVYACAFSPDGKTFASAGEPEPRTIKLWDVATGEEKATLRGHQEFVWSLAFSPDSKSLAAGDGEGAVLVWDTTTGAKIASLSGHEEGTDCIVFSPDGRALACIDAYNSIHLWDVTSGKNIAHIAKRERRQPRPRLLRFLQSAAESHAGISFPLPGIFDEPSPVPLSLRFTPDGKLMALGYDGRDHTVVRMWQVASVPGGH